jgi:hypothetical protein
VQIACPRLMDHPVLDDGCTPSAEQRHGHRERRLGKPDQDHRAQAIAFKSGMTGQYGEQATTLVMEFVRFPRERSRGR